MDSTINGILKDLKEERIRLCLDIKRIDMAIAALTGEEPTEIPEDSIPVLTPKAKQRQGGRTHEMRNKSVRWSQEVDKVFVENDMLKPVDVIKILIENGVQGLDDANTRKSVYATLNRKLGKTLMKKKTGEYYKK